MTDGGNMQNITRIPLEGVCNTRDLGVFRTKSGKRIKEKRLIRSGQLIGLTEQDKKKIVDEYHLARVIDFRTKAEHEDKPDPILPGVEMVHNPILEEKTLGITRDTQSQNSVIVTLVQKMQKKKNFSSEKYMQEMYENLITNAYCKNQYKNFIEILLQQDDGASLWHCSAGKDRVGVGTALLLSVLQVPKEVIIEDYLATNQFVEEEVEEIIEKVLGNSRSKELENQVRPLFCVEESYIQSVFTSIERQAGSVDAFLEKEMGLTDRKRASLEELYLI